MPPMAPMADERRQRWWQLPRTVTEVFATVSSANKAATVEMRAGGRSVNGRTARKIARNCLANGPNLSLFFRSLMHFGECLSINDARVAELADALDSGSSP